MRGMREEAHALGHAGQAVELVEHVVAARGLALGDRELGELEHGGGLAPARQPGRLVGAGDEGQVVLGSSVMERSQRIDRVGPSLPLDLVRRHLDPRRVADRQPAQLEPELGPRVGLQRLVRRRVDRQQQHAVELERDQRLLGAHHVPDVGRVERPAEEADARQAQAAPGRRPRPGT